MNRILIIDDEKQIRRFLTISLQSQGYKILEAETGAQGLERTALESPDMVILDLGLPDMDGQDVLRQLRDFYTGPVIVLSVRDHEREKVRALDNGCNDYVTKPFGINELLARIRAAFRTFHKLEPVSAIFDDGHLKIDRLERKVSIAGKPVHLSPKEFDLLVELVSYPGRILTQGMLLERVWGINHKEDTHYLRVFIGKLRAKLGDNPTSPRYIQTEAGVGYRFIGGE